MTTSIDLHEKQNFLRHNGWLQLWSEDAWLKKEEQYSIKNWKGHTTEEAYEMEILHQTKKDIHEPNHN